VDQLLVLKTMIVLVTSP